MSANTNTLRLKTGLFGVMALLVAFIVSPMRLMADAVNSETLLIINSYHEDELWASNMSKPVELYLAKIDSVRSETVFLNNSSVTDMETFNSICDNVFNKYADNHPSYVVLVGNFAINLCERIKQEWGDIPVLLISRIDTYAPNIEQYFANAEEESVEDSGQLPLGQLRDKYNFTAVIVPDFYTQNVDLMMDLIPDMKEFVFISDRAYVNKIAAMHLQGQMLEKYPDVEFRWIQGAQENTDEMIDMFIKPQPQTGILISSWVYEMENTRGIRVLTTKDLTFMSGSINPVFTMRQLYMNMGSVGGAFVDNKAIADNIIGVLEKMIHGENMRQVPFVVPEEPIVCVNYDLMNRYHLSFKNLPKDTIIINRPVTYFEKYWLISLIVLVALVVAILAMMWKNKVQRRQIDVLQRHNDFINNMPMPYTKATLWLDNDEKVVNINYELKNAAYDDLIKKNSMPDNPLHLFTNTYLNEITKKLLNDGEPVTIRHHFKRSGLYCYFIFVPIKTSVVMPKKKSASVDASAVKKLEIDVFAIDITKDQQMQQQLKDQAVTIDISMEMAKLVPWQWDANTDVISFYTYRNYLGNSGEADTSPQVSTSMRFEDFVKRLSPADSDEMMKIYHKIVRGECSHLDMDFRLYNNPGDETYEWCENHGVVTDTDSDGRPLRMTGSLQFITDRKHQEEEMAQALTKAKESDMLKSAFLANMSHEIRTPLNAIVGFSNLLTNTDDLNERREFAEIISRNNELLLSLINDILDLAKIESNTITLTYGLCDIHDVVDSISKTVSIRVPKGVKLNVAHYADSCIVRADASHVSQILINLLTNATKFTKRGSITVGYEIYEDENKLYFYVKDTGIGIKKENIEKVFNRFVKLNNFVQGSGLGLAICRTLVEKMGGEIGVESAGEGRGSLFWFTIPYDPMELKIEEKEQVDIVHDTLPADHIVGQHADRPAKVENSSFEFKTPGDISQNVLSEIPNNLTVLVAEDNPSNYWLMERLMQDKFKLFHAENGRIALEMLNEVNPDLIIMDINMPELDGYGAVEEMRKRGVKVPIIAVTAYAFASDRIRILNSGFDAFVSKPVSATMLYDAIDEVWGRNKLKQDNNNTAD